LNSQIEVIDAKCFCQIPAALVQLPWVVTAMRRPVLLMAGSRQWKASEFPANRRESAMYEPVPGRFEPLFTIGATETAALTEIHH
jgi:hypothetical protein